MYEKVQSALFSVDSQLLRDVVGVAEAVTVLAVIHPTPPEFPTPKATLVV